MDGRDGQPIPHPSSYFMQQRGFGATGFQNVFYGSSGMRSLPSPVQNLPMQPAGLGGGGPGGQGFQVESPPSPQPQSALSSSAGGQVAGEQSEPMRRKRGRPRKYGPDVKTGAGPIAERFAAGIGLAAGAGSGSTEFGLKRGRGRGRPPGSGKKQQLASYGEWISSSAGGAFTPHLLMISSGEDIGGKVLAFSQQAPRAICVLSATGSVSTVTLRQPSGGTVTYEGLFEILCLSGSYVLDSGGTQNRNGGLSISLSSPDGRVIGGGVGGQLVASSPVQVILGSFIFMSPKTKNKPMPGPELEPENDIQTEDQIESPPSTSANQNLSPIISGWPGPRQIDMRNPHMDIDLTQG